MKTVNCGFNKWSISLDENNNVVVSFNRYPIDGTITLCDSSLEDFENLGKMFTNEARRCRRSLAKKNKLK